MGGGIRFKSRARQANYRFHTGDTISHTVWDEFQARFSLKYAGRTHTKEILLQYIAARRSAFSTSPLSRKPPLKIVRRGGGWYCCLITRVLSYQTWCYIVTRVLSYHPCYLVTHMLFYHPCYLVTLMLFYHPCVISSPVRHGAATVLLALLLRNNVL